MNEKPVMILMRGTPGSGKSYHAKKLAGGDMSKIFSTDDFFEQDPRGYKAAFSGAKLGIAHKWNQDRVLEALKKRINPVIVDNTNIAFWQIKSYLDMAYDNGYEVRIEESQSDWWQNEIKPLLQDKEGNKEHLKAWADKLSSGFEHEGKIISNVHGVPADAIYNMLQKYEPYGDEDIQNYLASRKPT